MNRLIQLIKQEWKYFWQLNPHHRPWSLPVASTIASGIPLLIGAYFGHMGYGLTSSLGGMAFLYLPNTSLLHRMVSLMTACTAMAACFFCGLVLHFYPLFFVPGITLLAIGITMLCRSLRVQPPGSLFFLMAAMIAVYMPHTVEQVPLYLGLLTAGGLWACVVGLGYSLFRLWRGAGYDAMPDIERDFKLVVVDSLIIGIFIGIAALVAQLSGLPRPYWVPVACIAVIQGINFRAVWSKQLHRIAGTLGGMVLSFYLLSLPLNAWGICLVMMSLSFIIESLVARHYAAAVIFITPLTIFLAEAGAGMDAPVREIIEARVVDTVVGSVIGFIGGWCLHQLNLRDKLADWLHGWRKGQV
ncbi:FUSC family protein [Pelistega europaea]|uniref:FUSC family protein n=1 Tax=Pelistega europaea TaxID=106147 RepID=A0A7Y4L8Z0_9BURK|nr:FUSC family protein [Pelistega europaea]NOL49119.1 FUSC family protein [Pelistega europaea]